MLKRHWLPAICLFAALASPAAAGELDVLLERLLAGGNISAEDAALVRRAGADNPAPLSRLKVSGLMRLRYQYSDNRSLPYARSRGRFKLRGEAELGVSEAVSLGLALASGSSDDPRSSNQSFGDNASKKDIYIDRAFARAGAGRAAAYAGRMKNPLWVVGDMLWDSDVAIEGFCAGIEPSSSAGASFFGTAGLSVLEESASDPSDPYLLFVQQGLSYRSGGSGLAFKAAAALYSFSGVKGSAPLPHRPSAASGYLQANTLSGGVYKYDYDAAALDLEASWRLTALPPPLPGAARPDFAGAFAEFVKSLGHSRNSGGWTAGLRTGSRDPGCYGCWQLKAGLRRLERDAWPDTLPDSDFYGGSTGTEGSETQLTAGLGYGISAQLGYYDVRPIGAPSRRESLFQADLTFRF